MKKNVSPQAEKGDIDIANKFAEALMRTNLSSYQGRVLWVIWQKTYCWYEREDHIPICQLVKKTYRYCEF